MIIQFSPADARALAGAGVPIDKLASHVGESSDLLGPIFILPDLLIFLFHPLALDRRVSADASRPPFGPSLVLRPEGE